MTRFAIVVQMIASILTCKRIISFSSLSRQHVFQYPSRMSRQFMASKIEREIPELVSDKDDNLESPIEYSKHFQVDPGHVYFVATPIGNTQDVSKRMIDTLAQVDVICAEDTRHTRNLLSILGISYKKLLPHHEHNYIEQIPRIIALARNGSSIAVVSDAGTPGELLQLHLVEVCYVCFLRNNIVLCICQRIKCSFILYLLMIFNLFNNLFVQ